MKLFMRTLGDNPRTMSEVPIETLNIVIEMGNFRYRITANGDDALLVRETSSGSIVIRPEASNAVEIGAQH